MCTIEQANDDRSLLDACLKGDEAAWANLYSQYQPILVKMIRTKLGRRACDEDLVQDISSEIWFALLGRVKSRLAEFDASKRCRLFTFLNALVKYEILRTVRVINARGRRERLINLRHLNEYNNVNDEDVFLNEFCCTLTPREREFFCSHLMSMNACMMSGISRENAWQLRHRIMEKLRVYSGMERKD